MRLPPCPWRWEQLYRDKLAPRIRRLLAGEAFASRRRDCSTDRSWAKSSTTVWPSRHVLYVVAASSPSHRCSMLRTVMTCRLDKGIYRPAGAFSISTKEPRIRPSRTDPPGTSTARTTVCDSTPRPPCPGHHGTGGAVVLNQRNDHAGCCVPNQALTCVPLSSSAESWIRRVDLTKSGATDWAQPTVNPAGSWGC